MKRDIRNIHHSQCPTFQNSQNLKRRKFMLTDEPEFKPETSRAPSEEILQELLLKSTTQQLTTQEYYELYKMIQKIKEKVMPTSIGITPENINLFISMNPPVAILLFEFIFQTNCQPDEFLNAFLNGKADNLKSLEVLNRLITVMELPLDFVQQFILKCLQEERQCQMRVRHVTVFISSLFQRKILTLPKCSECFERIKVYLAGLAYIQECRELLDRVGELENVYQAMMML